MRVIGGTARGRRLRAVPGASTRPILDRVKKPLFDILRPRLAGMRVLDLFAGSGAVGIEALSEGAASCTFLDIEPQAIRTIEENLEETDFMEKSDVRCIDAFRFLRRATDSFDLIYVAPPQYKGLWVEALQAIGENPTLVRPGGLVVAQIDPREDETVELTGFTEVDRRRYGNTALVFWEKAR